MNFESLIGRRAMLSEIRKEPVVKGGKTYEFKRKVRKEWPCVIHGVVWMPDQAKTVFLVELTCGINGEEGHLQEVSLGGAERTALRLLPLDDLEVLAREGGK